MFDRSLATYGGKALSNAQIEFLTWLADQAVDLSVTGPSAKTIRIFRDKQNLAYVNGAVTERNALIGYHFQDDGRGSDSWSRDLDGSLVDWACARFNCVPGDLVVHRGSGANAHRTFLLIRSPAAAARALEIVARPIAASAVDERYPALEEVQQSFADAVQRSLSSSRAARLARLAQAPVLPDRITVVTHAFVRNSDVVAEVLFRANGACEHCGKPAPFTRRSNGTPYLEVHHKTQLSQGGKDTVANAVAVCPNCHRQQHHGSVA